MDGYHKQYSFHQPFQNRDRESIKMHIIQHHDVHHDTHAARKSASVNSCDVWNGKNGEPRDVRSCSSIGNTCSILRLAPMCRAISSGEWDPLEVRMADSQFFTRQKPTREESSKNQPRVITRNDSHSREDMLRKLSLS